MTAINHPLLTLTANEVLPFFAQTAGQSSGFLTDGFLFHAALIVALLAFNGFFVAMEVALIKLRESQLDQVEKTRADRVELTRKILENLPGYITACKIGSSAAGVLLGAVSVPFLVQLFQRAFVGLGVASPQLAGFLAFVFSIGVALSLLVVFGKVIPNSIGFRRELIVSLNCAPLLQAFYLGFFWLVIPLTRFADWVLEKILRIKPASDREIEHSAEDLRSIVEESGDETVTETEREILINTLELSDLTVYNILTPRKEVIALDINTPFEKNVQKALASHLVRFPVIDEHLDETLGWVHIRDLMSIMKHPKPNLKAVVREIPRIEEDMKLDQLLTTFLSRQSHIALVIDHYGGASGIVLLDDLLEILVGESLVESSADGSVIEEKLVEKVSDDVFLIDASMPLHELDDLVPELNIDFEVCDSSTVGGYVLSVIGHLPKAGESTQINGFNVAVVAADERKILEVKFERITEDRENDATEDTPPRRAEDNGASARPAKKTLPPVRVAAS